MAAGESSLRIRPAGPSDAQGIAAVHVAASREAFRGHLSDEELDTEERELLPLWRTRLEAPEPGRGVLVAEDRDVVGYCRFGPTGDADLDPEVVGEIDEIFVPPDAWERGVGTQLLHTALDELRKQGFPEAALWVMTWNDRARRFYEAQGWSLDGMEAERHGQPHLRYRGHTG